MYLPILDFNDFLNGSLDEKQSVSAKLVDSMKTYGFVYLKNFGIPSEKIGKMFEYSRMFFNKPIEEKMKLKKNHENFCGYDAIEEEKLTDERPADYKESFMIKKNMSINWPNDSNEMKNFMEEFYSNCYSLALKIIESIGLGLYIDPDLMIKHFNNGECALLRLLHYPPINCQLQENQLRCGEHTDYGALTLLFQDSAGGLELKSKNNNWESAPSIENTIIINIGDCMEMWTNGLLKSTFHRVVNPKDQKIKVSRYSTAFFCDPDLNSKIKVLDKFKNQNETLMYPEKLFRDHLFSKYNQSYSNFEKEKIKE